MKKIALALLFCLLPTVANAALAVRQTLASVRSTATSITRTYASAVLSGSLLVACGAVFNGTSNGEPTISDSVNGTWGAAATTGYFASGDTDSELWCWSFPNSAAGTPAVTMNPPGGTSDNDLTIFEVTGAATSSPRDISVTNTGTSSVNPVTTSVVTGTLAQADEIIFSSSSHTHNDRTITEDTGDSFTLADENESNSSGQTFQVQYKIVAATTTLTVNSTLGNTGTESVSWFAGAMSFKESGAAPPTVRRRAPLIL
jgi:hypothetical protein